MGRFTVIPQSTFDELQMDAGILVNSFDPSNPTVQDANIITATTGGFTISAKPTFSDLGSDVDNCPENTKELKHLDSWAVTATFTALGTSAAKLKLALGCADIDASNAGKVTPRADLKQEDFADIWWIGDRADGGFVAVKIENALSTEGLSLKTTKNGKGNLSVTMTAHVSIANQKKVPIEFYSMDEDVDAVNIILDKTAATVAVDGTVTLTASKNPADAVVTWSSSDETVATVTSGGVVTGEAAGTAVIVAKATKSGVDAVATCVVTVETAGEG